jgi:hypothetical protein
MTTLPERFRRHADALQRDAPLYAVLLQGMADDWDAGGAVRDVCAGWERAPAGAVVQLRLLGGLHRLVLSGRAPQLVPFYRNLGGTRPPAAAWTVARRVVAAHFEELRAALDIAPQTNEIGRSVALIVGLFDVASRTGMNRIRLLEMGASAGLNLLVDQFRIGGDGWEWGPADSPVVLEGFVRGVPEVATVEIVSRRGCDLAPVHPRSAAGRLRLRSFVWPDHLDRHARLNAALRVAQHIAAAPVDQEPAAQWLLNRLSDPVEPDVLTVVWHSLLWQYLPEGEQQTVRSLLAQAGPRLAHVALEPEQGRPFRLPTLQVTTVRGSSLERRVLADVGYHGNPVRLRTSAPTQLPM